MDKLHDMHCHLDFITDAEQLAADARAGETLLFANTVTPQGWQDARVRFADCPNVVVGFGMHPWWVEACEPESPDDPPEAMPALSQRQRRRAAIQDAAFDSAEDAVARAQRACVQELLERFDPPVLGEIGLDLGPCHARTCAQQLQMFQLVATWAARRGGKLLSVHSVRAAVPVMEILESAGALEACTCVFHWFTGPSDVLKRAVQAGCYFSCGVRMLATKKGREYVKAIPAGRLLLETDAPPAPQMPYSYAQLRAGLEEAASQVESIKGAGILETIAETSRMLLKR